MPLIDGVRHLTTELRPPGHVLRLLAGCALAGLGLACATGPAAGILPTAEIMRHLERLELRDEDPALRLTKPGRRHPVYLTGRELEDGAVVVFEVRF
jgi:hypothetical protein